MQYPQFSIGAENLKANLHHGGAEGRQCPTDAGVAGLEAKVYGVLQSFSIVRSDDIAISYVKARLIGDASDPISLLSRIFSQPILVSKSRRKQGFRFLKYYKASELWLVAAPMEAS